MNNSQQGFTFVEIAVVLLILGILVTGVSKGYELIVQARIKSVANDITGIITAVHGYRDRYRAIPGDDTSGARWSGSVPGNGNGIVNGLYNAVASPVPISSEETNLFWWHLRQSGFLAGAIDAQEGPRQPMNAAGGRFGVQEANGALGLNGLIICTSVSDKVAIGTDNLLDDGNPATGFVRAMVGTFDTPLGATPVPNYVQNDDSYVLCISTQWR